MGPRVELKQEPVSPLIVINNPWVILLTSGLFFDITTSLIKAGTRITINQSWQVELVEFLESSPEADAIQWGGG